MPQLTVHSAAALARLSARLGELVTNSFLDGLTRQTKIPSDGSNKKRRLNTFLANAWTLATKAQMEGLVATIVLEAYSRHEHGDVVLTQEDVDDFVAEMRCLDLRPQKLALRTWRKSLPRRNASVDPPLPSSAPEGGAPMVRPGHSSARLQARRHDSAIRHMTQLLHPSQDPQARGRQLELIVHSVLQAEGLSPERNVVNPGEQIDCAFTLEGQHYLVECKWEREPTGTPPVVLFMGRVSRKAEGTFGVFLSMAGFADHINDVAAFGQRLNCVGMTGSTFMQVLEGATSWSQQIERARRAASQRSIFVS